MAKKRSTAKIMLKVAVLIEKGGKLLLIRERMRPTDPYKWNLVKGSFDAGDDPDLVTAARRECWEEARARVHIAKLQEVLYTYYPKTDVALAQFSFVGRLVGNRFGLAPRHEQKKFFEDIVEARLFSKAELRKMKRSDFITERAYFTVREWLRGAPRHSLGLLKKTLN